MPALSRSETIACPGIFITWYNTLVHKHHLVIRFILLDRTYKLPTSWFVLLGELILLIAR